MVFFNIANRVQFDNLYAGSVNRINNLNYGDNITFARYRRPAQSNYNINNIKQSNAYSSQSLERNAGHIAPSNRNSSHSIGRPMRDQDGNNSMHQKTKSVAKINTSNLIYHQSYDASLNNAYKNNGESVAKVTQQDQPLINSYRRNSSREMNAEPISKAINHTISYDDRQENILPDVNILKRSESPILSKSYKNLKQNGEGRLYDSLDQHLNNGIRGASPERNGDYMSSIQPNANTGVRAKLRSSLGSLNMTKARGITTRQDVERQSIEHDRYYNRLNQMNTKQQQIFEKYLVDQLVPNKDREKQLEEIEKQKREEAKGRLQQLDQGSKNNQKALKNEYQKYLNNQMRQRERETENVKQIKMQALNDMKSFAAMEKQKDDDERVQKIQMQNAYRNALQSQEYLKSKQKLNVEIKLQQAVVHGGQADSLYTFGGIYVKNDQNKSNNSKSYLPPNPIVNPVSDPMYNPYLRNDILHGTHEFNR